MHLKAAGQQVSKTRVRHPCCSVTAKRRRKLYIMLYKRQGRIVPTSTDVELNLDGLEN